MNEGAYASKCGHIMKFYSTPFIPIDSLVSGDKVSYRNFLVHMKPPGIAYVHKNKVDVVHGDQKVSVHLMIVL
jgi:hypothetical protein